MRKHRIGILLIALSLITGTILFALISSYQAEAERLGCYQDAECGVVEERLNITHILTGIISFLLSLGVYIVAFHTSEEKLVQKIDKAEEKIQGNERYELLTRLLGEADTNILTHIKEHGAIKQTRLRDVTGYSKAKISESVKFFEDKNLVSKEKMGRTNQITYLGP